jgi:putative FmdB family regulatory protein
MPLYEYECEDCGHRFERIQKFSDSLVEVCPKCGKRKVHKLVSSPAIQFKGSGFYINDYARKGTTEAGTEDSKTSESAKPAKPAKNDEKSADKPPASPSTTTTPSASNSKESSSNSKESSSTSKDSKD